MSRLSHRCLGLLLFMVATVGAGCGGEPNGAGTGTSSGSGGDADTDSEPAGGSRGGGSGGGTGAPSHPGVGPGAAPTAVAPMVAAGSGFSLALARNGTVFGWGSEAGGTLGNGIYGVTYTRTPEQVPGLSGIVRIAAGESHGLALRVDGTVFAWGVGTAGRLGLGSELGETMPRQVPGLADIVDVVAGLEFSVALRSDGTLFTWGANQSGQLGVGDASARLVPTAVPGIGAVVKVAAGGSHVLALGADGSLWAWGTNGNGELGLGDKNPRVLPTRVAALANQRVVLIAAGDFHSLAVTDTQSLFGWGASFVGQASALADTTDGYGELLTPTLAFENVGVTAIAAGKEHSMALLANGLVATWGHNGSGRLGNGGSGRSQSTPDPQQAIGIVNAIAIDAGADHSLVVHTDGTVSCFGDNFTAECGRIETTGLSMPVPVGPGFNLGAAP